MAGKSGSNGRSQWNTCGGTTLDAKLVRKVHLMAWKWPKNGQFGPKLPFLAILGLIDPPWLVKVEQMMDHSGGTTLDAKFVRKMHPMLWKWPKIANFGPKPPFLAISGLIDPPRLVKVE